MPFGKRARPRKLKMWGKELSEIIINHGLTQSSCGLLVGEYPYVINRWVHNQRSIPKTAAILFRLLAKGRITIRDIENA